MKTPFDDSRLTAYVLGELSPADAKEVEAMMKSSPEIFQFVQELKILRGLLQEKQESVGELSSTQHIFLKNYFRKKQSGGFMNFFKKIFSGWRIPVATLATGALIFVITPLIQNKKEIGIAEKEKRIAVQAAHTEKNKTQNPLNQGKTQGTSDAVNKNKPLEKKELETMNVEEDQLVGYRLDRTGSIMPPPRPSPTSFSTEAYDRIDDNDFRLVSADPLSTFSIDVDTASYSNVRRFILQNQKPPQDAVRIEEMVNYFIYEGDTPTDGKPFAVHTEVAPAPWEPKHQIMKVTLKGKEIPESERPAANLVFLIDVSGSMDSPDKLPLLKESLRLLINKLKENDRIALAVYAGSSGLVLPSTPASHKEEILSALNNLQAGGSTNGGEGIQLAYKTAQEHFIKGGINRVILATDGDFNVGTTDQGSLTRLIEEKAKSGVFLSVLGFGRGNLKDSTMEKLADRGNGNYAYIDSVSEARKALVEQMGGTLVTIAKDVKIQVEFNPAHVAAYRLVGYENRMLKNQDFNNDKIDAGEIGAGHTVTALYELIPVGVSVTIPGVDPLKYQKPANLIPGEAPSSELLTVKLRYKEPEGQESQLMEIPVQQSAQTLEAASTDFKFATAVAGFGMLLRESPYKGKLTYDSVLELARQGVGNDTTGYRYEFVSLVTKAKAMMP